LHPILVLALGILGFVGEGAASLADSLEDFFFSVSGKNDNRVYNLGLKQLTTRSCKVVRSVVFTRWQLHCPTTTILAGHFLLQQGGTIQF
jgi:hypothetical protein